MIPNTVNLFTKGANDNLKFKSVVLFCTILSIMFMNFEKNYVNMIILIVFCFISVEIFVSVYQKGTQEYNELVMYKLDVLQKIVDKYIETELYKGSDNIKKVSKEEVDRIKKRYVLDSMYKDPRMIVFLYSIRELSKYNHGQFYKIVKGVNGILKMKREIGDYYRETGGYLDGTSDMVKLAIGLKVNLMNNLHDMIYTIPKAPSMYEYLDNSLGIFEKLLDKNIQDLYQYHIRMIESQGTNMSTVFIQDPALKLPRSGYTTFKQHQHRYIE